MLSRLKKFIAVLLICSACTGCWDSTEIDQLAIVVASGFDLVQQEGKPSSVRSTLQIALPSELGSNGGGAPTSKTGSTNAFVLEEADGPDPLSSIDIVRKRLSRRLFLGQRRVIVIGEDYAKRGIYDLADEIVRNPQSRLRTYVVVAYHSTAESILSLPYPLNRLPADAISDIESQGAVPVVDAKQMLQHLVSKGDPYAMGIEQVQTKQAATDDAHTFALTHIAVFQKDKLVGWLSGAQLRGFIMIYGQVRREDTTVNMTGVPGYVTARMLKMNTERSIHMNQGQPTIDINTRTEYDVAENGTPLDLNDPKNVEQLRSAITTELTNQMKSTMNDLQHKYQSDPFGFTDKLNEKYPAAWLKIKGDWRNEYSKMPTKLHVEVDIRNSGLTGPSIRSSQPSTAPSQKEQS